MTIDFSSFATVLLSQGLMALRNNAITPKLVNSDLEDEAAQPNSSIQVPIPPIIATNAVTPGVVPPASVSGTASHVSVPLDHWREAPFQLTDKQMKEVMAGTIPSTASEAVSALVDYVDRTVLNTYKGVYGFIGTPGAVPFASDVSDATDAGTTLSLQKAAVRDRRFILDPLAYGNALQLRAFQDSSWTGDARTIKDGEIREKLGFSFWMNQNLPTHTNANGTPTGWLVDQDDVAVNDLVVTIDTGSNDPVEGDVFTIAGDTQTYVVASYATNVITFQPPAQVAWAEDAVITFKGAHKVNIAFQKNAIAFASRPLAEGIDGLGNIIEQETDPVSGLSLRLEISRQHKQTRFAFDILFGVELVRPQLAVRLAGQ